MNAQRLALNPRYILYSSLTLLKADLDRHQPRMWRCGQEYQYPIPKPDGNPWEVVLESLLKKDQVQCAAWKDEVQNLLIFVRGVSVLF